MSNYWKQRATKLGRDARLISAKLVSAVRQYQKINSDTFVRVKHPVTKWKCHLINKIDDILEDNENKLFAEFRQALRVA